MLMSLLMVSQSSSQVQNASTCVESCVMESCWSTMHPQAPQSRMSSTRLGPFWSLQGLLPWLGPGTICRQGLTSRSAHFDTALLTKFCLAWFCVLPGTMPACLNGNVHTTHCRSKISLDCRMVFGLKQILSSCVWSCHCGHAQPGAVVAPVSSCMIKCRCCCCLSFQFEAQPGCRLTELGYKAKNLHFGNQCLFTASAYSTTWGM